MEVPAVAVPNILLDHKAVEAEVNVTNLADLQVTTQEGDLVDLSFATEFGFGASQSETATADGSFTQELSTEALAASQYSLSVQGDLNEDELDAIRELVDRVRPLAEEFFRNGELDLGEAVSSLTQSLGVIQEVELELEQTIATTFRFEQSRVVSGEEVPEGEGSAVPIPTSLFPEVAEGEEVGLLRFPSVRDISELVLSVVENEFPAQAVRILGSEAIIKSLDELMSFLRDKLTTFVNGSESEGTTTAAPTAEPAVTEDAVAV